MIQKCSQKPWKIFYMNVFLFWLWELFMTTKVLKYLNQCFARLPFNWVPENPTRGPRGIYLKQENTNSIIMMTNLICCLLVSWLRGSVILNRVKFDRFLPFSWRFEYEIVIKWPLQLNFVIYQLLYQLFHIQTFMRNTKMYQTLYCAQFVFKKNYHVVINPIQDVCNPCINSRKFWISTSIAPTYYSH